MPHLEASDHPDLFVPHRYPERTVDLGEVRMNYAVVGDPAATPLVLVPGQSDSWWSYEKVMPALAERFQVFAVDLRGQGRSTWTPGRYTLDLIAGDVLRFLDMAVGAPAVVAGHSSGGTVAAWLSAYAKPGQVLAACYEDAPLFSSETRPAVGQSIDQALGPVFRLWSTWLGDQWKIGDAAGMVAALPTELPAELLRSMGSLAGPPDPDAPPGPPQSLREYDPEWGRAFSSGTATASCDHATMLSHVKTPVLFTHHYREVDEATGRLLGAVSDEQVRIAGKMVRRAGQAFEVRSFPDMPHSMHAHGPETYVRSITEWWDGLGL